MFILFYTVFKNEMKKIFLYSVALILSASAFLFCSRNESTNDEGTNATNDNAAPILDSARAKDSLP